MLTLVRRPSATRPTAAVAAVTRPTAAVAAVTRPTAAVAAVAVAAVAAAVAKNVVLAKYVVLFLFNRFWPMASLELHP